jgi:diacylglycerol kinase family enzyme
VVAVMNAEFVGEWDVAPRSHPNDGRAEVVVVDPTMSVRERVQAWRRLRSGTHAPHPSITARQVTAETVTFGRELAVWVDGVRRGSARSITVAVVPDAAAVYA